MSVHIGELHTDVTPAPAPHPEPSVPVGEPNAAEARARAEWVAARVHAEGFDD